MTDIKLTWQPRAFRADLSLDGRQLALDDGLESAVIISLFSDRRAEADDDLPQPGGELRGWWGDFAASVEGDRIGSRLWLLSREKELSAVCVRAKTYAEEALAWLIEDGVASSVLVTSEIVGPGVLGLGVDIHRPEGPARLRFDYVWKAV